MLPQRSLVDEAPADDRVVGEKVELRRIARFATDGVVGSYHEVHFAPHYGTHFTLYGSQAQLDVEANHDTGECWAQVTRRHSHDQRRERPSRDTGHGGADPLLLADFAVAVRTGREPVSGLRAGYESAQIGIATRLSIDSGKVVELPRLEADQDGPGLADIHPRTPAATAGV